MSTKEGPLKGAKLRRKFSMTDQIGFAKFSQDFNPIHVAPHSAGSTHTGQAVVHGMHLVLWLIEVMCSSEKLTAIKSLEVRFLKPCFVGDEAVAVVERSSPDLVHGEVRIGSAILMDMDLRSCEAEPLTSSTSRARRVVGGKPKLLLEADMIGQRGVVQFPQMDSYALKHFAKTNTRLGGALVAICAALSQVVGMHVPGLYSLFSGFYIEFDDVVRQASDLRYEVLKVDSRFHLVTIVVSCGGVAKGKIKAFWREPKVLQPPMSEIAKMINGTPYKGKHALVIGGSRGIGEATAKLIAAGGGQVTITYQSSKPECARVAKEIAEFGGVCVSKRFDALQPVAAQLTKLKSLPDAVFFFATPRIFGRRTLAFDPSLFEKFIAYYVTAFADVCVSLSSTSVKQVTIFYPSSTALEESVPDMIEYSMAKAAGEEFCRLSGSSKVRIVDRRLPRIATDQTHTFFHVEAMSAAEAMLPILNEVLA